MMKQKTQLNEQKSHYKIMNAITVYSYTNVKVQHEELKHYNFYFKGKHNMYVYTDTIEKYLNNLSSLFNKLEQNQNPIDETIDDYSMFEPYIVYYDSNCKEHNANDLFNKYNIGLGDLKIGQIEEVMLALD